LKNEPIETLKQRRIDIVNSIHNFEARICVWGHVSNSQICVTQMSERTWLFGWRMRPTGWDEDWGESEVTSDCETTRIERTTISSLRIAHNLWIKSETPPPNPQNFALFEPNCHRFSSVKLSPQYWDSSDHEFDAQLALNIVSPAITNWINS
jgi:hypothetical protein